MKQQPVPRFVTSQDITRIWIALIVMVILIGANITLNGIRTYRVDHGINRLEADRAQLLKERGILLARLAAKRP